MRLNNRAVVKTTYAVVAIVIIVVAAVTAIYLPKLLTPPAPAKDTIKVGVSLSLSGGFASPSQRQLWGMLMWVEDVNAKGGIYVADLGKNLKVNLVYYDDRGDSATATRLYERLITEDKVDILMGPYGSGIAMAVSPVAEKYGIPMINQMGASDAIPKAGFNNVFTVIAVTSEFALSRVELMGQLGKANTFGILTSNELYPLTVANPTKALLENKGYKSVFWEEYPRGLTDFSAVLLRAKTANPDFFYMVCYPADAFVAMRQMKDINFAPKLVMFDDGPNDPQFIPVFGKDAEGVTTQMSWTWYLPFPSVKNFTARFLERYGENPRHWSSMPYAAGEIMAYAIQKAGTLQPDKVRQALLQMQDVMTLVGPVTFGDWVSPMGDKLHNINMRANNYVLQIQGGTMRVITPASYANTNIAYPWHPSWAT
jgi:branched-chain amino acid transport system substrate-binding protein